jgi:Rps23 Pro-64 3,4-dihydroxylase Tpa1-like proline 4-hydroxylase
MQTQSLPNSELPQEIELTLLLSGGQQYTLPLETSNPLLRQLFEVLVDPENNAPRRFFQIPINRGRAVLGFPSDHLIGVVTEPPLIIQPQAPADVESPVQSPVQSSVESPVSPPQQGESVPTQIPVPPAPPQPDAAQSIATALPTKPVSAKSRGINPLVSNYVQVDNFLTTEQLTALYRYVLQQEDQFVPTTTSTGEADYRRSLVLYQFPEFAELINQRIRLVLPQVLSKFGLEPFPVTQVEAQLTAHNQGHYYRVHNDNGSPDTATRVLTYVYYFFRSPKLFKGGELLIYDSKVENNFYVKADTYRTVEPRSNSVVFFLSRYMHEVLPIQCPSQTFADSRFTINGWIRR